jgi:hypothetical protein
MLKPTVMNISKMAEDYLYDALDQFQEDIVTVALIEMELNLRAKVRSASLERAKVNEIHKMMQEQAIQEELKVFFAQFPGSVMPKLVNLLEPDFINDYEICEETFVVVSKVALEGQNNIHECDSLKSARSKAVELAYKRVWDKYVYRGDLSTLEYLKQKLVA